MDRRIRWGTWNDGPITRIFRPCPKASVNGTFSTFMANQSGYNTLNDTENSTQNTTIGTNSSAIAALVIVDAAHSIQISTAEGNITNLKNAVGNLGNTTFNLDHKLNSFIIETTRHLESLDSSVVNIGTTLNSQSNRITNYEDRVVISPSGIIFKSQTINAVNFTNLNLGVSINMSIDKDLLAKRKLYYFRNCSITCY